jgi:hypothetical protein
MNPPRGVGYRRLAEDNAPGGVIASGKMSAARALAGDFRHGRGRFLFGRHPYDFAGPRKRLLYPSRRQTMDLGIQASNFEWRDVGVAFSATDGAGPGCATDIGGHSLRRGYGDAMRPLYAVNHWSSTS